MRNPNSSVAICITVLLSAAVFAGSSAGPSFEGPKATAAACFARIKSLSGDWYQKDQKSGKETLALRYRVTSGGNTVEEAEFPGAAHEMLTLYTMDGDKLVLTHYCSLGNQPRMKATESSTPSKIVFECAGGGNMKSESDMHMHHLVLNVQSADHIISEWSLYKDGKSAGHEAKFDVRRKAAK